MLILISHNVRPFQFWSVIVLENELYFELNSYLCD